MSVYFNRKEELKAKASNHYKMMEAGFKDEIAECVKNTKMYGGDGAAVAVTIKREVDRDLKDETELAAETAQRPEIIVDRLDSVKSMLQHRSGKTAVLNFASYKNHGGKFMEGSSAQEECLCHASTLYNVLRRFPSYYDWNKKHNNRALYTNRALYSEDVIFLDESVCVYGADPEQVRADVITCAAPNYSAAGKYANVEMDENNAELFRRIKFVLDVAEENKVETLVLGAFGCGVFGQDAAVVAKYFKKCLDTYDYHFKKVYFSVLNRGKDDNYTKFRTIFGVKEK